MSSEKADAKNSLESVQSFAHTMKSLFNSAMMSRSVTTLSTTRS